MRILVSRFTNSMMIRRLSDSHRLDVVVRDDLVWLRWITVILGKVLVDLRLCILRDSRRICGRVVAALVG